MESFELQIENMTVPVEAIRTGGRVLYIVKFETGIPLVVHRAQKFEGAMFWTSIPEGRQTEAEKIGALIDNYLKTKKT